MKTEYLILPESMVVVALCLVGLIIIAAGLIGYFIGLNDGKQIYEKHNQPKGNQ